MREIAGLLSAAMVLGASLCATRVLAQVPPDIAVQNRALGERIDVPTAIKTYGSLQEMPPYGEVKIIRDLVYGPDVRHRLDVFIAKKPAARRLPVMIFATGGDFTRSIDLPGGAPFYDNVMLWAAKHGFVGVNADRRYHKDRPWETGPEDISRMIGWVHDHIADYGGDPRKVVFFGHAYGGTQFISYASHPEFWCCSGPGVEAAAVVSAPLNLPPATSAGAGNANRPTNSLFDPAHSDLDGLAHITIPIFVGTAQFDSPAQSQSAKLLQERLCAAGHCPAFHSFENHNHFSVMFSFNTSDESVSDAFLQWARRL